MKDTIDVIIPVYRPDDILRQLLLRLRTQSVQPGRILLMHTKASEEDSLEEWIDGVEGVEVYPLKKEEFDHGGTRNQGAAKSNATFILFMTQDALPEDDNLIASMVTNMQDILVGACYARQLPNAEAGIVERYTRSFNYPDESRVKHKEDLPELGIKTYFCSNVCALYRKKVYDRMGGFVLQTIFNEDMIMAAKMIQAGYGIAYAADARVIHSHTYTYRQQYKRNFDLAVSHCEYAEIFSDVPPQSEGMKLVLGNMRYLCKQGKWYLVPDLVLMSGFKYLGYKAGLRYKNMTRKQIMKRTMNPSYWKER